MERIRTTDVLLVSDHTLPQHLNLSTGGANGEERLFIDPTITSLSDKLLAAGLKPFTLNVEDMTINGEITNRKDFDAAYAQYDEILSAAVNAGATIVAIHYDADLISAEDYGSDATCASAEKKAGNMDMSVGFSSYSMRVPQATLPAARRDNYPPRSNFATAQCCRFSYSPRL